MGFLIKNRNPEETVNYYYKATGEYPTSFTFAKNGNSYTNCQVSVNEDNATLKTTCKEEDKPVLYEPTDHGTVIEGVNDFTITGIENKFKCPEGFEKVGVDCQVRPICNAKDPPGSTRGINLIQFNNLSRTENPYHPRMYVMCDGTTGLGQIHECDINELYNMNEINDPLVNPCGKYDICSDNTSGYRHRRPINDNDKIKENEFYSCQSGVSVKFQCEDSLIFNEALQGCLPKGPCFGKPDGFQTIIDVGKTFITCKNELPISTSCIYGIITTSEDKFICEEPCKEEVLYAKSSNCEWCWKIVTCNDNLPSVLQTSPNWIEEAVTISGNKIMVQKPKDGFFIFEADGTITNHKKEEWLLVFNGTTITTTLWGRTFDREINDLVVSTLEEDGTIKLDGEIITNVAPPLIPSLIGLVKLGEMKHTQMGATVEVNGGPIEYSNALVGLTDATQKSGTTYSDKILHAAVDGVDYFVDSFVNYTYPGGFVGISNIFADAEKEEVYGVIESITNFRPHLDVFYTYKMENDKFVWTLVKDISNIPVNVYYDEKLEVILSKTLTQSK